MLRNRFGGFHFSKYTVFPSFSGPNAGTDTVPEIMPTPGGNMPDDTCVHSVDAITTLTGDSVLAFMGEF